MIDLSSLFCSRVLFVVRSTARDFYDIGLLYNNTEREKTDLIILSQLYILILIYNCFTVIIVITLSRAKFGFYTVVFIINDTIFASVRNAIGLDYINRVVTIANNAAL